MNYFKKILVFNELIKKMPSNCFAHHATTIKYLEIIKIYLFVIKNRLLLINNVTDK